MSSIKITAVSYLNTVPFIYGIRHSGLLPDAELLLSPPAGCAELMRSGQVDIGLIPIAEIPSIPDIRIIGNHCIGANREVGTVALLSDDPLPRITDIYLDDHSRTSVSLVRILASDHWKIAPLWHPLNAEKDIFPAPRAGYTVIGDKVFRYEKDFRFKYDLAREWNDLTGLPFVFAAWVARGHVGESAIERLNAALDHGVRNIEKAVREDARMGLRTSVDYLTHNIDFRMDDKKKEAMRLFFIKQKQMADMGSGSDNAPNDKRLP